MEKLLTVKEVAEILKRSPAQVNRLCRLGMIKFVMFDYERLFLEKDVRAFVERYTMQKDAEENVIKKKRGKGNGAGV